MAIASAPLRLDDAHAPLHLADAENCHLRLVDDDGGRQQTAADAVIGYRERPAADILGREFAVARGGDELAEPPCDLQQAQLLRAVHDGHDESLAAERRTDSDVALRVQHERVRLEARVDFRLLAQGAGARGDEIGGEREPHSLPLELAHMPLAMRKHPRQVRFEQRRDVRCGRDAAHHVLGDPAADGRVRMPRSHGFRVRRMTLDVGSRDAPLASGAFDV